MQDIELQYVRYSQASIYPYITNGDSMCSVEIWKDELPYNTPLEVIRIYDEAYVCIDNKLLYALKKHFIGQQTKIIKCIVYELTDKPTTTMRECGMDTINLYWINQDILHHLCMRTNTMDGVMIARCALQNSDFSKNGEDVTPIVSSKRLFEKNLMKLFHGKFNTSSFEQFLLDPDVKIYVKPIPGFNIYHERSDLREIILTRPDIFYCVEYQQCDKFYGWSEITTGNSIYSYEVFKASEASNKIEDFYSLRTKI
jgi:hypothetical protein